MAENSNIEWTDHTVNCIIGCAKVDELCANCYAEDLDERRFSKTLDGGSKELPVRHWGLNAPRYARIEQAKAELVALDRKARKAGRLDKVFINSLSDTFEDRIELEGARLALFNKVAECENLIFQLLTKRPENVTRMVPDRWLSDWPWNALMGTSVGHQKSADDRIPELLKIPAKVRFLSCEPLLGPVDIEWYLLGRCIQCGETHYDWQRWLDPKTKVVADAPTGLSECGHCGMEFPDDEFKDYYNQDIHWVISGGESGPNARPMHPDWARSLRDQCVAAGVPFFFKQWGEWVPRSACYHTFADGKSCSDMDPCATRWPCIRLTYEGNDGRRWEHAGEGDDAYMQRVGKKAAGRLLDGREWNEFPDVTKGSLC